MKKIEFVVKEKIYSIPNEWESLTPEQYLYVCRLLADFAAGKKSVMEIKLLYICRIMDWNPDKIKGDISWQNLYMLARKVDFIFEIVYPDGILSGLPKDVREKARKTEPAELLSTYSRYLQKQDYKYRIDACFPTQLVPEFTFGEKRYRGYEIRTEFDRITCNLTAIQFIEAREILSEIQGSTDKLPLLTAILYYPDTYSSAGAHKLAATFKDLDPVLLQAISINFQAFISFLFTRTQFSLLSAGKDEPLPAICTGMLESLYNLSQDGIGDLSAVEQMDCITYLIILRKKMIEAVKTMHDYKIEKTEISEKTGLSIKIINKILS